MPSIEDPVLTLREFCDTHKICRTKLWKLCKEGRGPRMIRDGRFVRITMEAAADWRRQMEAAA